VNKNLETALITILGISSVVIISVGIVSQQDLASLKASQVDWSEILRATIALQEVEHMISSESSFDKVEAVNLLHSVNQHLASASANDSNVFRFTRSDVNQSLQSLSAKNSPRDARAYIKTSLTAIVNETGAYIMARRSKVYQETAWRSWLIIAVGIESLLALVVSMFCLRDRNKHQRLLLLANEKLQESNRLLEELSDTDPLTGLLNRRGLEKFVTEERNRSKRTEKTIMVVLIDCDDFKQVNEKYGHSGGDAVLRTIAQRLKKMMRVTDHIARIGGDEFLIVCPETNLSSSKILLDRLLFAISSEAVLIDNIGVSVTVSAGAAELPCLISGIDDALTATRESLLASKQKGKNQVGYAEQ
jgi:diguanylate cyclase (GGDEF)-like protein